MGKKLTQVEVAKIYAKQGYELISEYKGALELLYVKDNEGYICSSYFNNFNKQGRKPNKFHKNNPYTIQNIKLWIETNAQKYELLSTEYNRNNTHLIFKCPKSHEFEMSWGNFQQGKRCPKCSHHLVSEDTSIYAIAPWMIDLGVGKEDAKKYLPQSNQKITVTCPYCNKQKEVVLRDIYKNKSIGCCSNGISYSEKFIASFLDQLKIKYEREYSSKWSKNKRYDFYLFDYNMIIECHGMQHYEKGFDTCGGKTLQEEIQNDEYKKQLALKNGIDEYIVLDCRESNLEYIKNSIINSTLNNLFNLFNIDWFKCEKYALGNKVKEVCDYWHLHNEINNENLTTNDVGSIFKLKKSCHYKIFKTRN